MGGDVIPAPTAYVALGAPRLRRLLARAQARCDSCSAARAALPPGSSRARVTTANARWARAAEERDRILTALECLEARP